MPDEHFQKLLSGVKEMAEMEKEEKEILGYAPNHSGDGFVPIYPPKKGFVYTQAFIICEVCGKPISAMGGPRPGSLCVECYGEE